MDLVPLGRDTLSDLVCLPGGLELAGKDFAGDLGAVRAWHAARLAEGLRGLVAYDAGRPRGFVELMPAETAPFPIEAPGAWVLLCFHWAGTAPDAPEHLERERELLKAALDGVPRDATGVATLGWNHATHYPISLLTSLGFREVVRDEPIALLWRPFRARASAPRLAPPRVAPRDLSRDGLLAIDAAWSARCPYSVRFAERVRRAVDAQPDREHISLTQVAIDTRDDAFAFAASPWDWGWIYLNGRPLDPFAFSDEAALALAIARSVPGSGRVT